MHSGSKYYELIPEADHGSPIETMTKNPLYKTPNNTQEQNIGSF